MKKILIGKGDAAAEVVGKILGEEDAVVVVVVPRDAILKETAGDFELIKREAAEAGKNISIESVDEEVLEMAKGVGLEAIHPLFKDGVPGSSLTDIIPKAVGKKIEIKSKIDGAVKLTVTDLKDKSVRTKEAAKAGLTKKYKKNAEEEPGPENKMLNIPKEEEAVQISPKTVAEAKPEMHLEEAEPRAAGKKWSLWKPVLFVIIPVATIAGVAWIVTAYFSRVQITINFNKIPWIYEKSFLADKSVSKMDLDKNVIQAEVFEPKKNVVKSFKASSVKSVSAKATGKMTIYNAYSSVPQSLVATTRFVSPDGKIFRLNQKVTVPGAQIKNGKITPAKIDADITADQAGPDYNVGPIPKLTIPGFKGSPKYAAFYGEVSGSLSGGFVGQRAVPTPNDIKNAKDDVAAALKTQLEEKSFNSYPADFKILDNASQFSITRISVNENTDDKGNFAVFGEASEKTIGFRESDIKSFLLAVAGKDNPNMVFDKLDLAYAGMSPDFQNEKLSFSLKAQGVLKPNFSASDFNGKILGKKVGDARSLVSGLRGLSSAKVSVWPFWLQSVPLDPKKVNVIEN